MRAGCLGWGGVWDFWENTQKKKKKVLREHKHGAIEKRIPGFEQGMKNKTCSSALSLPRCNAYMTEVGIIYTLITPANG
jgi:hypothetical protein